MVAETAKKIEKDAKSLAPRRSGNLAKSISSFVANKKRDGLTARIGIRTKAAKRRAWYAHFVEFGTRGYSKGAVRRTKGSRTTKVIAGNVKAQPARPFLFPAADMNRTEFKRKSRAGLKKALKRARKYR